MLTPEALGHALAAAPDPELARVALSRVGEDPSARDLLARPEIFEAAVPLLGFSSAAADLLVRSPSEVEALADLRARTHRELTAELSLDVERFGAEAGLRRFRRRVMMRVAARDLAMAPVDEIVAEISAIADVAIAEAVRRTAGDEGFVVIGMGKLGGSELNYASDVDLIFLHADPGPPAQAVAEEAGAAIIRLLSASTAEGIALRVDTALRPGGRSGALSRSLEATVAYYATGSAVWERQALIKARGIAGDLALGERFLREVAPIVYPADLGVDAIEEVRRTKVRLEEYVRQRGKELTEVKRGRGGIRDVEFAVQLLQLVHGRRDHRLRVPGTLRALRALAFEGYVADPDAEALAEAYRFLRRLEHRLQIVRDLQTHDLPADRRARTTIARSLGLRGADELQDEVERTTGLVRSIHERLFYRPLLEAFAGPTAPTPGTDRRATEELLTGLGFRSPARSFEVLARTVDPSTRIGRVLAHEFPVMAPALALAADPDPALVRLERVVEAVRAMRGPAVGHGPEDVLANDPAAARRLAHVAAASSFGTDLLVADPRRILGLSDTLLGAETDAAGDLVNVVARAAGRELLPAETGAALTAVADRVLREAVAAAEPEVPFAVIGMGKLGARELNVASDLDVMFVYEGEGPEDLRRATTTAERVMAHARAAGWEPDADLRPEGKNGPLARSMAAYLEYWGRHADLWEFQSLLRARVVAGTPELGRRFELNAADLAYPPDGLTIDRVAEIRRMRERIERERVKPPEAAKFHLKLGHGSLADVQFTVELELMRTGGAHPEVRSRRTLEAIERLADIRAIEQSVARDLGEAFVFLMDVKNALEMDRRLHAEAIPPDPVAQTALARRLGFETYPRQSFLDEYLRITRRARRAMERVFARALEPGP